MDSIIYCIVNTCVEKNEGKNAPKTTTTCEKNRTAIGPPSFQVFLQISSSHGLLFQVVKPRNVYSAMIDKYNVSEDMDFVRLTLSLCAIVLNAYVFVALLLTREFRTALGTLAKALTFGDMVLQGACVHDFYRLWKDWNPNVRMCNRSSFVISTSLSASMVLMTAIIGERFYALIHPKRYPVLITNCKTYLFVGACYVVCGLCSLPALLGLEMNPDYVPQSCVIYWEDYSAFGFLFITILFIFSVCYISLCSCRILKAMRRDLEMTDNFSARDHASTAQAPADFDRKTTKAFLAIAVVFYTMWLPFLLMSLKYHFVTDLVSFPLYNSMLNLGLSSGITKCIIHLAWMPLFKKRLLGTCCCSLACNCVNGVARLPDFYRNNYCLWSVR